MENTTGRHQDLVACGELSRLIVSGELASPFSTLKRKLREKHRDTVRSKAREQYKAPCYAVPYQVIDATQRNVYVYIACFFSSFED